MNFLRFLLHNWREVASLTGEHLVLVAVSVSAAAAIGLPAGVLLTRYVSWKRPVLALTGVLQTVPSLALFGLLIPLPLVGGIGARTAVIALALYALLPVVRNTVTGIEGVDQNVREAARAMGMTGRQILWQVELPLASSFILAGLRVATVISVGVATVAAAIGAGGLGTYIFRGIRQYDNNLLLAGAVPAALLALAADGLLGLCEARLDYKQRTSARRAATPPGQRRRILRFALPALVALAVAGAGFGVWRARHRRYDLRVGSKDFTESVILAEIAAQELEAAGLSVERRFELGGNLCHDALISDEIDLYPEYTGTSFTAILKHQPITDPRAVYEQIKREYAAQFAVETSAPLGFSNDFAILVRGADARRLSLTTISDAAPHARGWRAGFGQDFMSRADGYSGFQRAYGLDFAAQPREMDLALTYRALAEGQVDLIAGNSTDGLIAALDLFQLADDRRYFPPYEAVFLTRRDALAGAAGAPLRETLRRLSVALSTAEMRRLNHEVDGRQRRVAEVVREWRGTREQGQVTGQ